MYWHGSHFAGLSAIAANSVSHTTEHNVAYFTESRAYALVCCRPPEENFVTAGIRNDGKLHYYERFPHQLETMYRGKTGYLYTAEKTASWRPSSKPLAFESESDVPITGCERIPDVYAALQAELQNGAMVLHRYAEIDPAEQLLHADFIRAHIAEPAFASRRAFLERNFAPLWKKPMRELFSMDRHDCDPTLPRIVRPSVRAIIVRGEQIAMMYVQKYDYYKFPGGGIDDGETQIETLIRETREEAGLVVRPETVRPYGMVPRVQLSKERDHVFEQMNYYYRCEAEPDPVPTAQDAYETEEGFTLVWATPKAVIAANRAFEAAGHGYGMAEREARVVECLLAEGVLPVV